ncbi:MAG: hypothetical protein RDV48_00010 [Candidatus Eremiobacteraeota bacterium]|nr:hypothetical protein [Candidatus Eremiobacteraeota bacterium]
MATTETRRMRLSIDINPEEHRKIKMCAALNDESVSAYVLKAVEKRLQSDLELEIFRMMTAKGDPVLAELWDNEKDSAYDSL